MLHFAEMTDEERCARLERKATEIRKMLFGSLLLAKDAWKDELSRREEGIEIMEAMEKAEESFTEGSQPDMFKRLEHTFDVINRRAKSIFDLMSYVSKYKKRD
jgi:predicted  nucleic acid-binding Zn-ribbon protein